MADGTPIGALAVRIGADASQLVSELKRADKAVGKHQETIQAATKAAGLFAAAAAATGAALAVMVKNATDNADAMSKMAQGAGVATRVFSEYAHAANLSNLSNQQLSQAFSKLNVSIVDAAKGTGEAAQAYKSLGVEVRNADGSLKSSDVLMEELADALMAVTDESVRAGLSAKIFGERLGKDMIPMLSGGSAGLREMREEARALGATIDTDVGKAAERFNDNLTRLGTVQQGLANRLMAELLPAMVSVTDQLVAAAKNSKDLDSNIKSLADGIQSGALVVFQALAVTGANVAYVLKQTGNEIGGIAAQLAALATGDFKAFSDIGRMMKEDAEIARKELDEFEKRIMGLSLKPGAKDAFSFDESTLKGAGQNGEGRTPLFGGGQDEKALREAYLKEFEILQEAKALGDEFLLEQREKELELEREHQEALREIRYQEVMNEEEIQADVNRVLVEARDKQLAMEKKKAAERQRATQNFMQNLGSLMNTESRRLFEIGKAAQIAMAVVEGYKSVMSAYRWGMEVGGPPVAVAFGAAAALATANMVNNIRAQQFGSGGAGAAPVAPAQGSSNVAASAPAAGGAGGSSGPTRIFNINVSGSGRAVMEEFARGFNALAEEGFVFKLNGQPV